MEQVNSFEKERTKVTLRIFGLNFNPDEVSKNLELTPSHLHWQGNYPKNNPKYAAYRHNMWMLNFEFSEEENLEIHLSNFLGLIEGKQEYLKILADNNSIDLLCVLYSQNGFQLSPKILERIASINASLGVIVYPSGDELEEIDVIE